MSLTVLNLSTPVSAACCGCCARYAGNSASRLVVDDVQLPDWLFPAQEEQQGQAEGQADVSAALAAAVEAAAAEDDQAATAEQEAEAATEVEAKLAVAVAGMEMEEPAEAGEAVEVLAGAALAGAVASAASALQAQRMEGAWRGFPCMAGVGGWRGLANSYLNELVHAKDSCPSIWCCVL
jgi:hypothetical protein